MQTKKHFPINFSPLSPECPILTPGWGIIYAAVVPRMAQTCVTHDTNLCH